MTKAEQYIQDYTRKCSNVIYYHNHNYTNGTNCDANAGIEVTYSPWLTPDHAREVAKIAKEEVIEGAVEYIKQNWVWNNKIIEDFRNAMEGGL